MGPGGRHGPKGMTADKKLDFKTFARVLGYFRSYIPHMIAVVICLVTYSLISVKAASFIGGIIDNFIDPALKGAAFDTEGLLKSILSMGVLYLTAIVTQFITNRILVVVGQGILRDIRNSMFAKMQRLPIKYFDTNAHGDIMSRYTNDTDTLRQLISNTLPQMISSTITVVTVFFAMLSRNIILTAVALLIVGSMLFITRKIGLRSARHFLKQQQALGDLNGYVEEMVSGQKVVKVFNHEEKSVEGFDKRNEELCEQATKANILSNILGPINNNFGHFAYALIAMAGGAIAIIGGASEEGLFVLSLGGVVTFLNLFKNFQQPINMVMQQFNILVMAMAGAARIFELIDQPPEADEGNVTLVRCSIASDGKITESDDRTGRWAWKYPKDDGTLEYVPLQGDVRFFDVDFGYEPDRMVLHDISLYAKPGQKLAFVGATGAGKTTITNLINRFYDIADGKIRYDGININRIKKSSLRSSLGIVLQDVNLFTGTVMENIRYGRLDATDDECIAAAKLANADGFIRMLPDGYNTVLSGDGSGLSQGQRQLIAIARAAVMDPPVMILDEATSSIDTRTEAIVQKGMDGLMAGRTVFVIAHRLSTVKNSDAIMVLEKGRVIERGTHDQLIEQKGQYYSLYTGAFELE